MNFLGSIFGVILSGAQKVNFFEALQALGSHAKQLTVSSNKIYILIGLTDAPINRESLLKSPTYTTICVRFFLILLEPYTPFGEYLLFSGAPYANTR